MEAQPRPQIVLYVNTDLPVPDLADTLRIETLDASGETIADRRWTLPDRLDWPVSFGVASEGGARRAVRLRVRSYSATRVASRTPSLRSGDVAHDDPLPTFVIDRVVELSLPTARVERFEILLSGECLGVPADPATGIGCVPGEGHEAAPDGGLREVDRHLIPGKDSRTGTWSEAVPKPCVGTPRGPSELADEEVCVPGGVFFLGDERLGASPCSPHCNPFPEVLARMSPFFLDKHEVTVGRWRAALEAGFDPEGGWLPKGAGGLALCTFGPDSDPRLPMTCVTQRAARELCRFDGGRALVTEAQWEAAASGRGQERLYVWGSDLPDCHLAAYARIGPALGLRFFGGVPPATIGSYGECGPSGEGPAPVGSFPLDVTRDGAMDLGANVQEWTDDVIEDFGAGCWTSPLPRDPRCSAGTFPEHHTLRGGSWGAGSGRLAASWRDGRTDGTATGEETPWLGPFTGFRCSRSAGP